jgi:ketosteroid isomerase-like protein
MRLRALPVSLATLVLCASLRAQQLQPQPLPLDPLAKPAAPEANMSNALSDPTLSPGVAFLFQLEARFAQDTAKGGGKAFSSWFADDAVTLANKEAPVRGHSAIAAQATWAPEQYQLTWTPQSGLMSPAGDMGYTWGHYEGHAKDRSGNAFTTSGRYMTIWKKQSDGQWKVVLDASSEEPPSAGDCCKLP